jgi:dipeptidyl aminopeptidase/acylaminoacyl peptidase
MRPVSLPCLALSLALPLLLAAPAMARPVADAAAAPPAIALGDVELIPREALFGNPERTALRISPDGRSLSWLAPVDGVLNVFVAPADDPSKARAVTQDRGRGIRQYFWSYRPDTLLYVRDTGGDEDFHLFAVDVASGQARDLTPFPKTRAVMVGVSHEVPDTVMVGMNDRDPAWHDLYRVELASGERTLVEQNTRQIANYLVDARYAVRMAARSRPDGGMDLLARDASGDWSVSETIPFGDVLTTRPLGYTQDGGTLYMIDSRDRNTAALYATDTASGERTLVFEDPRADIGDALTEPRSGRVQAASSNYLREEWTVLDPALRADFEALRALGPGEVSVVSRTLDDRHWIVAYSAAEQPVTYYRYDNADNRATRLFSTRPALDGKPLVPMWPQEIRARDGNTLVSYLSLPRAADPDGDGKPDRAVPMVLLVHGGPWARDEYGYSSFDQWLANRGYAVLSVNYRGSTGFGKAFVNAADGEWAGKMHDDLIDAVAWAVEQGVTTPDKVAIMGGSYGGYATLVGLTFTPDTFACGVDIVGPSNLETLLNTIPPYWASYFEQFARRVGDPRTEAGRNLLNERSPLNHVDRIRKPLLIGQGANDPRVKQSESDQIVQAMSKAEIPVTYVLFPDEGHGFARPENAMAFNAVAEGFLAECLGGRAQPIGDFAGSSIQVPNGANGVKGLAQALEAHTPQNRR